MNTKQRVNTEILQVRLPKGLKRRVQRQARAHGLPVALFVRLVLANRLDELEGVPSYEDSPVVHGRKVR